jgi:hypothetical protein
MDRGLGEVKRYEQRFTGSSTASRSSLLKDCKIRGAVPFASDNRPSAKKRETPAVFSAERRFIFVVNLNT